MASIIKTYSDLLLELKNKGVEEIEKYLNIGHNPTIGSMYEGLTKDIAKKTVFEGLDLHVVSGKITNKAGKFSKQIDCMIVVGDGVKLPYTDEYIYQINQVVMVIEVKKNLYTNELSQGYENLKSVKDLQNNNYRELALAPIADSFKMFTKTEFPDLNEISSLDDQKQMLYHLLVVESLLPLRVIIGISGFSSELVLRNKFIEYLSDKTLESGGIGRGFGPASFPNLIIAGNNAIVKTNGMPYILDLEGTDDFCWLASYRRNPMVLFLELLWTRLTCQHGLLSNVFGDEMYNETIAPLLTIHALSNGWSYKQICYSQERLDIIDEMCKSWEPMPLTQEEYILMNQLCNGNRITVFGLEEAVGKNIVDTMIHRLTKERLIYIDGGEIKLLTKACLCVIVPGFGYVAADDYDGKLTAWLNKKMVEFRS